MDADTAGLVRRGRSRWAVLWRNEVSPTSLTPASLCVARPASTRRGVRASEERGLLPSSRRVSRTPGPFHTLTEVSTLLPAPPLPAKRNPPGSLPLHGEARCLLPRQLIVKEIAFPVPP